MESAVPSTGPTTKKGSRKTSLTLSLSTPTRREPGLLCPFSFPGHTERYRLENRGCMCVGFVGHMHRDKGRTRLHSRASRTARNYFSKDSPWQGVLSTVGSRQPRQNFEGDSDWSASLRTRTGRMRLAAAPDIGQLSWLTMYVAKSEKSATRQPTHGGRSRMRRN
jgi:hypothetical protein